MNRLSSAAGSIDAPLGTRRDSNMRICAPGNVRSLRNSPTTAWLTWDEPYCECPLCPDAQGFEISGEGIDTVNVAHSPCQITGLVAGQEYKLFLRAKAGEDHWSTAGRCVLRPLPGKPGELKLEKITPTSVILSWSATSSGAPALDYMIACNGTSVAHICGFKYELSEFPSGSLVTLEVRARNGIPLA